MLTIGVDLGGTKVLGVVADGAGAVVAETLRPSGDGAEAVLAGLAAVVAELAVAVPAAEAVGVGVAGMVDYEGVVRYAPNIPGIEGLEVATRLEKACRLPVAVDNDANVAALGEVLHGAARGHSEVLLVTLGTGIGGGIVTAGRLLRGGHGYAAEIGHFTIDPDGPPCSCGVRGHWESFASGSALGRMGREWAARGDAPGVLRRAGGDPAAVAGQHVGESAAAGEADGMALLDMYAHYVAVGLGGLVNIFDPEVVVVSGGLVTLGDVLLERIRAALPAFVEAPEHRVVPPVVAAQLGSRAGAIGAAALARPLAEAAQDVHDE
ncbi:MAG TPA: ROK family protein [Acidimicrobiia bacterium]